MNILLIGSGGREHAMAWKLVSSPKLSKLFIAPGNAGTASFGTNLPVAVDDFPALEKIVREHDIQMVVVGPEDPLVKGIHNYFSAIPDLGHLLVVGPDAAGAQLEGSKEFAKAFMQRNRIPTARYRSFRVGQSEEARQFMSTLSAPYVLKADGLAAGKGVVILPTIEEAVEELSAMFGGKFGKAGNTVVIEEFLSGIEVSVFVLTDGKHYLILPEAKDYKRVGAGDIGPNTGGMGAVSPVSFATPDFMRKVEERIVIPTVQGLQNERIDYRGFLFIGLMNVDGDPYVIEYNVRMGDPETEAVMPRLNSDLLNLFESLRNQTLNRQTLDVDKRFVTTIVLVSGGYPGDYAKGKVISGLDAPSEALIFHAGTRFEGTSVVTNGGRVLAVSAKGDTLQEALDISNRSAGKLQYEAKYFRPDIGFDLLAR